MYPIFSGGRDCYGYQAAARRAEAGRHMLQSSEVDVAMQARLEYLNVLREGENVLMLPHPAWGDSTLWQAEADFRFRTADGALNPVPPGELGADSVVRALGANELPPGGGAAVVDFARRRGASTILLDATRPRPWREALSAAGREPDLVGGVYLYRLDDRSRTGCGGATSGLRATALRLGPR